jgi:hypothetical protein
MLDGRALSLGRAGGHQMWVWILSLVFLSLVLLSSVSLNLLLPSLVFLSPVLLNLVFLSLVLIVARRTDKLSVMLFFKIPKPRRYDPRKGCLNLPVAIPSSPTRRYD